MLEDLKGLIEDLRRLDIGQEPDAYMERFCGFTEALSREAREVRSCDPEEPYDDSIGERLNAFMSNGPLFWGRFYHQGRCYSMAGTVGRILRDAIIPHYGSYEAVPEQYRTRIETSLKRAADEMDQEG